MEHGTSHVALEPGEDSQDAPPPGGGTKEGTDVEKDVCCRTTHASFQTPSNRVGINIPSLAFLSTLDGQTVRVKMAEMHLLKQWEDDEAHHGTLQRKCITPGDNNFDVRGRVREKF